MELRFPISDLLERSDDSLARLVDGEWAPALVDALRRARAAANVTTAGETRGPTVGVSCDVATGHCTVDVHIPLG